MMSGAAAAASMGTTRSANAQNRNSAQDGNALPHIVIFNPDQFRAEAVGHLGNPAAVTPNLDRMAQTDGVSFSNAFCQNPVCTPSRCSFMTGWYPHTRGHRSMHYMLHEDEPVLLKTLKDNGYYVWWGGKNDLVPAQKPDPWAEHCSLKHTPAEGDAIRTNLHLDVSWRTPEGSSHYYSFFAGKLDKKGEKTYHDSDLEFVTAACEFLDNAPADQPVCIYLPLQYPHPPYGAEEPYFSSIDRKKIPQRIPAPDGWKDKPGVLKGVYENQNLQGLSEKEWTEIKATYYAMCSRIDDQFGMVMDALKRNSMYDDTAVFFFSDHGDFTGDYGLVEKTQNTFEDLLTNVPLVIKPPSSVKVKPGVRDALVELIDFPATVEDLTGIEPNHTHFGRSLLPLLEGGTGVHRDAVFCEGGHRHGELHCGERTTTNFTDPTGLYWPRVSMQKIEGPEGTKAVMCRTITHKYVKRLYEKDELYDMVNDPNGLHNRIDDPTLSGVLQKLKDRMLTFFLDTGDVVPHELDARWPGENI